VLALFVALRKRTLQCAQEQEGTGGCYSTSETRNQLVPSQITVIPANCVVRVREPKPSMFAPPPETVTVLTPPLMRFTVYSRPRLSVAEGRVIVTLPEPESTKTTLSMSVRV